MQGDVSVLAETDVLDKQLRSGQLETPAIFAVVGASDPDYVTHEDGGQSGNNTNEVQSGYYNNVVCNTKTCHQETQTNLFTLVTVH